MLTDLPDSIRATNWSAADHARSLARFESDGTRYLVAFDRLQENTLPEDLPAKPGANVS